MYAYYSRLCLTTIATIVLSTTALANPYANMDQAQMQKMMQAAQKMQTCMQGIDQSEINRLQKKGEALEKEVKALCQAGKRQKAQSVALKRGKAISSDPAMKKMMKCGQGMDGFIADIMPMAQASTQDASGRPKHLCDDM